MDLSVCEGVCHSGVRGLYIWVCVKGEGTMYLRVCDRVCHSEVRGPWIWMCSQLPCFSLSVCAVFSSDSDSEEEPALLLGEDRTSL